jgi:TetR/AcrR family transcriptional regulator, repressor for uid operon
MNDLLPSLTAIGEPGDNKVRTMTLANDKPRGREARRLETRQRIYDAAIAEFKRSGMADADVSSIVAAAGVAWGTFYLHFATKEHVLLELQGREEARVTTELTKFLATPRDLESTLTEVVRLVTAAERRLGSRLFKDVAALDFLPTRPREHEQADQHPVLPLLIGEIERACERGDGTADIDAYCSAVFFLLGLNALLTTTNDSRSARADMLKKFVISACRSIRVQ